MRQRQICSLPVLPFWRMPRVNSARPLRAIKMGLSHLGITANKKRCCVHPHSISFVISSQFDLFLGRKTAFFSQFIVFCLLFPFSTSRSTKYTFGSRTKISALNLHAPKRGISLRICYFKNFRSTFSLFCRCD